MEITIDKRRTERERETENAFYVTETAISAL